MAFSLTLEIRGEDASRIEEEIVSDDEHAEGNDEGEGEGDEKFSFIALSIAIKWE